MNSTRNPLIGGEGEEFEVTGSPTTVWYGQGKTYAKVLLQPGKYRIGLPFEVWGDPVPNTGKFAYWEDPAGVVADPPPAPGEPAPTQATAADILAAAQISIAHSDQRNAGQYERATSAFIDYQNEHLRHDTARLGLEERSVVAQEKPPKRELDHGSLAEATKEQAAAIRGQAAQFAADSAQQLALVDKRLAATLWAAVLQEDVAATTSIEKRIAAAIAVEEAFFKRWGRVGGGKTMPGGGPPLALP